MSTPRRSLDSERGDSRRRLGRHDRPPPFPPDWRSKGADWSLQQWGPLVWYFILMLAMLWFWQEASHQFTTRTIPYSEFKALVAAHRVADLTVQQTDIAGRVVPKPSAKPAAEKEISTLRETNVPKAAPSKGTGAETNGPANVAQGGKAKGNAASPEAYLFRTVRVEDPATCCCTRLRSPAG
jgi:hypothetical protein